MEDGFARTRAARNPIRENDGSCEAGNWALGKNEEVSVTQKTCVSRARRPDWYVCARG